MMNNKGLWILQCLIFISAVDTYSQRFFEVETIDQAEVKVWYVMDDTECDLKIHFVYDEGSISKVGLWMEVPNESQADIKIIFVDDPKLADINVCVTDYADQAGWINPDKSSIIKF